MLGLEIRYQSEFQRNLIRKEVAKGVFKGLSHAAARLRQIAMESIQINPFPSPRGFPPYSRRGQLKRAIFFKVEKNSAVIGPVESRVGTSASAHEFGGRYKKERFSKRPFMGPSLEQLIPRFAGSFKGSIG